MFSLIIIVAVIAMIVAANRFAARKQQDGTWDESGPRNPLPSRPAGADIYSIYDGGLRRAFEQHHGAEGLVNPPVHETPPVLPPLDDDLPPPQAQQDDAR